MTTMAVTFDAKVVIMDMEEGKESDVITVLDKVLPGTNMTNKAKVMNVLDSVLPQTMHTENQLALLKPTGPNVKTTAAPARHSDALQKTASNRMKANRLKRLPLTTKGPQFYKRMLLNMLMGQNALLEDTNMQTSQPEKHTPFAQKQAVKKMVQLFKLVEKYTAKQQENIQAEQGGEAAPSTITNHNAEFDSPQTTTNMSYQSTDTSNFTDVLETGTRPVNTIPSFGGDLSSGKPGVGLQGSAGAQRSTTTSSLVGAVLTHSLTDSSQDMDLIDILWRQDMDLGVGREVFDGNLRKELEKEKELELKKLETFNAQKDAVPEPEAQSSNLNFTVDSETGEMIPDPPVLALPVAQLPQADAGDQTDIDEAMQLLAQHITNIPPVQVNNQQEQFNNTPDFQDFGRQHSFEQRWDDVANILNIQPNNTDMEMANMPQNALLQNATLAAQPNNTDFNINGQMGLMTNNDTFNPFTSTLPQDANNNTTLYNMDSQGLVFGNNNVTEPQSMFQNNTFNNQTENLLQGLLNDEDLQALDFEAMDINQTNNDVKVERDSDSAVGSSMAGSISPVTNMNDSMSNISSPYDGMEGATGGQEDELLTKFVPKQEVFNSSYSYSEYGSYNDDHMRLNSSGSSDDQSVPLNADADPRHVAHNHTYPLQPGQIPRERKQTPEERRALASMSRDEKKAKAMKIPISMDDIVNSPVEEFNEILQKYKLSEPQLQMIRDIRRRGKNKVAAQNCRKRKMEIINSLDDEVMQIRRERDRLIREKHQISKQRGEMRHKYHNLYDEVFRSLRDDSGHPYDPSQYSLQQTADGNVFLVPINTTAPAGDHDEKRTHKRKGKKGNH